MSQFPSSGTPGIFASTLSLAYRTMFTIPTNASDFVPGGRLLDGANTRDPGNSPVYEIRAGLVLGRIAATGLLAAAIVGKTTAAVLQGGTSLTLAAVAAVELVRRVGTSGTLAFTANFGAVPAINQVENCVVVSSSGVGTFTLTIEGVTTGTITHNDTIATLVSNINTALNTTFGTGAVVASGASLAALIFTFSGPGFAGRPLVGHIGVSLTVASGTLTYNGSATTSSTLTTTLGISAVGAGARTVPVAFSAVNTSTGVVTITAVNAGAVAAVNQIEATPFVDSTGVGTFTLTVEGVTTAAITYSSTAATLNTNINSAINTTFGTSAIVASGASLAAIILTFSGPGYAGRPINGHVTSAITITSGSFTINGSATAGTSTTTTAGVAAVPTPEGDYPAGAIVGANDGSATPVTFVVGPAPLRVTDVNGTSQLTELPLIPITSKPVKVSYLIDYPTDAGLIAWFKAKLRVNVAGMIFSDDLE